MGVGIVVGAKVLKFTTESTPVGPVSGVTSVPAMYKFELSVTAMVAAFKGMVLVTALVVISTTATPAALPPHSFPQLRTKAFEPSLLKTAVYGRLNPGFGCDTAFEFVRSTKVTVSELSLNATIVLPFLVMAKRRT